MAFCNSFLLEFKKTYPHIALLMGEGLRESLSGKCMLGHYYRTDRDNPLLQIIDKGLENIFSRFLSSEENTNTVINLIPKANKWKKEIKSSKVIDIKTAHLHGKFRSTLSEIEIASLLLEKGCNISFEEKIQCGNLNTDIDIKACLGSYTFFVEVKAADIFMLEKEGPKKKLQFEKQLEELIAKKIKERLCLDIKVCVSFPETSYYFFSEEEKTSLKITDNYLEPFADKILSDYLAGKAQKTENGCMLYYHINEKNRSLPFDEGKGYYTIQVLLNPRVCMGQAEAFLPVPGKDELNAHVEKILEKFKTKEKEDQKFIEEAAKKYQPYIGYFNWYVREWVQDFWKDIKEPDLDRAKAEYESVLKEFPEAKYVSGIVISYMLDCNACKFKKIFVKNEKAYLPVNEKIIKLFEPEHVIYLKP